ncbi:MAG: type II toxin-antitoxin system VapC family toxin [Salinisphaera sp.]|nr:type II toxin-antitoxin system VapC family toxin [Salinisphaera sp.]
MTLFDSDVFIWHLRGYAGAQEALLSIEQPALSAVTLMEVLQGARNRREQRTCHQTLVDLNAWVLPLNPETTAVAIRLIEIHALKDGLTLADALIAATALQYEHPLLTANRKHFAPIRHLQVLYFDPR